MSILLTDEAIRTATRQMRSAEAAGPMTDADKAAMACIGLVGHHRTVGREALVEKVAQAAYEWRLATFRLSAPEWPDARPDKEALAFAGAIVTLFVGPKEQEGGSDA